jgi:hypothetical protein
MLSQESQNPDNPSSELIILNGQRTSGAEHNVWLDRDSGVVRKIPSSFGRFWQKMHPDFAQRDLSVMQSSGIPVVPTAIHRNAEVIYAEQTREYVSYVLEQPLYESSHPLTYSDLLHNPKYRKYLLEIMRIGREIREKYNLGLDLLGGKIVKLFGPVLNPLKKSMPAEINNLLVADNNIVTNQDWTDFGVKKDELFAQKGEVRLCDTRMYDFDRQGFKGNSLKKVLLLAQDAQDCANWSLLKHFGLKAEFDFESNRVRRMVAYLMSLAIPKMQSYAEAIG